MSNYKPNPLLDDYNKPSNEAANIDRNKNQAANIVNNFMSAQPDRKPNNSDFAKIQAIYNNYQSLNYPINPQSTQDSVEKSNHSDNESASDIKPVKKSWIAFGKNKSNPLLHAENLTPVPLVTRKRSWKNRFAWLVSFGLVIGGLSWYFILIQPSGLEVIYASSQSQINKLSAQNKNLVTSVIAYIKDLDKYTHPTVSSSCLNQSLITNESTNQRAMDEFLSDKLVLKNTQTEITKETNILTYKYFDNNYAVLNTSYEDSQKNLKQNLESLSYIPELVQYKNRYIEGCQGLANKGFNVDTITEFCTELEPKKTDTIKSFGLLEIPANSKLSTSVAKSIQSCNNRPKLGTNGRLAKDSTTIAIWQEQFDLSYDEFMGRRIPMDKITKDLEALNTQFDEEVEKVKASNQKEYDRKKAGFPNFYILQPNTKVIAKRLPI